MDERFEVETSLGPVWFHGRDTGRPILLVISGAFAAEDFFWKIQALFPTADVLRTHLPGNHCPHLVDTSIQTFATAYDEALAARWPGRPLLAFGVSAGGIVAMGLRTPALRGLVVIEPPLLTEGVWPLVLFREQAPPDGQAFVWSVFGVGAESIEPRDHSWVLDGLSAPTLVMIGGDPLMPRRVFTRLPSLLTDATRRRLAAHPLISIETAPDAGHNIPRDAALQQHQAVLRAWNAAFPDHPTG